MYSWLDQGVQMCVLRCFTRNTSGKFSVLHQGLGMYPFGVSPEEQDARQ